MQIKKSRKKTTALLALVPFAWMTACGGGGGGGGTSSTGTSTSSDSLPASTTAAISSVPLAGEVVADCTDTAVGIIDSIVDSTSDLTGGVLPVAIPKLSDVIALLDLSKLPVIGGQVSSATGVLSTISASDAIALLPTGVPGLANLPLTGQLPVVCSSLLSSLPAGAATDPTQLLALLGNPTTALGLIPIFDSSNNPVGVLLATLPSGLLPTSGGGSSSGGSTLPDLTQLVPIDTSTLPVVGPEISGVVDNLLGVLDTNSLLTGGLGGLLGII